MVASRVPISAALLRVLAPAVAKRPLRVPERFGQEAAQSSLILFFSFSTVQLEELARINFVKIELWSYRTKELVPLQLHFQVFQWKKNKFGKTSCGAVELYNSCTVV